MQSFRNQASKIIRVQKNAHRFICFINGKIRTFCTRVEDIDSQVAALFGSLNAKTLAPQLALASAMLIIALTTQSSYALDPLALPTGWQSVSGNHQFDQNNGVLNVTTGSNRSIVNYDTFNIGSGARVNFNLPSSNSSILNRVTGGGMSEIYGTMSSNGKVFLVNPAGIFFGNGANVSVNGLVASTLGIADHKFLSGLFEFTRENGSAQGHIKIDPNAKITINNGGSASFLASSFTNAGTINAPGGAIQIGVGDRITLGDNLIGITVNEALKDTLDRTAIMNSGILTAAQVKLIASTLKQNVLDTIVNNTGRISANKVIDGAGGVIELVADHGLINNSGVIDASGTKGGNIVLDGQSSQSSGELLAMGTSGIGGDIHVLGSDSVSLVGNAIVDVSGQTGGGNALIGGDLQGNNPAIRNALYTYVDQDVQINARALNAGNGGKVIVWGIEATGFYGTILAQGGLHGGNGGFVETSGKNLLLMDGHVDASALHPDGHGGTWLLDPRDVVISDRNNSITSFYDWFSNTQVYGSSSILWDVSEIKASAINAALNQGTDVTIHTGNYGLQDGDITIRSNILKSSGSAATLQLLAADDIVIDSNGSIKSTSNSPLHVILKADNDIFGWCLSDGYGSITLNGDINLKNGNVTLSGQNITLNKLLKTSGDVTFTALDGNILQNLLTSSVSGRNLLATASGVNYRIDLRNADFNSVQLSTDSGRIDYSDTDGVTATVNVGNGNTAANVVSNAAGSASNGTAESDLIISDINKAKELNFTAKSGDIKMLSNGDSASGTQVILTAENGAITQQAGSITGSTSVKLDANGASGTITQNGGSITAPNVTLEATKGIKQSAGTLKATNLLDIDSTGGMISQSGGSMTGSTVNITNTAGGISQTGGSIKGDTAVDMSSTGGSIALSGTGSVTAPTVKLTATNGAITQSGGTIQGTSLTAQTNTSGQAISINNADFNSASLTSTNGNIQHSDRDGATVTVKAGSGTANVTTSATGVTANNSTSETDLIISGANTASDATFTAKSGNITQGSGHSVTATNNATLSAEAGNITEGGILSASNAVTMNASGSITQTGGTINGQFVSMTSNTGAINQTGGTLHGSSLTAETKAANQAITIGNADFASAALTTNNSKIDYSDRDGLSITVKAGTNIANVTSFATGVTANNSTTESNLVINGANSAKDLNLTARKGDITLASDSSAIASQNATLIAQQGSIKQSGGSLSATNALSASATGGKIEQTGGTMSGSSVTLSSTNDSITQSAGSISATTSVELTSTNGSIQQSGTGSMTAPTMKLIATNGGISQTARTIQGTSLTAQTTTGGQAISILNADFDNAALTTNNGKIDYSDRDGMSATVKAGTNTANVTTFATGATANNNAVENNLVINGANTAKDINLTAKKVDITLTSGSSATASQNATLISEQGGIKQSGGSLSATNTLSATGAAIEQTGGSMNSSAVTLNSTNGSISQSAGSITGTSSLELTSNGGNIQQSGSGSLTAPTMKLTANNGSINQTGGSMQGTSLSALTTTAGQGISITNADFNSAALTSNNGKIDYSDRDGVSAIVKAGTNTASVTTFATGATADNTIVESNLTINGANTAKDITFTAKKGDITLFAGSSAVASQNATLVAQQGNIKQSGETLSAASTLSLSATGGGITQTGGVMNGQTVKLNATGDIEQSGGDMFGRDLQVTTTVAGEVIDIHHADFKTAQLTTNRGNIHYIDSDGVSVTANTGSTINNNIKIEAETGSDMNGSVESGIILVGNNLSNTIDLSTNAGHISQANGSTINAVDLVVKTNTGNVTLDRANANDINTLTATSKSGNVSYQDKNGVTLQSINLDSDNNGSRGDLSIQAHGTGNIDQANAIVGIDVLSVKTDDGDVALNRNGNDANHLSASSKGGDVTYHDANSINVTGVNLNNDIFGPAGNLTLQANGSGNITQTGAIYNVDTLSVKTNTGSTTLTNGLNNVRHLDAKSNSSDVSYRDLDDVNIKSANLNIDDNSHRGNLTVQTSFGGDITQSGVIEGVDTLKLRTDTGNVNLQLANNINKLDAGTNYGTFSFTNSKSFTVTGGNMNINGLLWKGDLNLTAQTGTISQTAAINASELKVNGNANLTNANNTVDVFSAFGDDVTVSFTDKNGFNLGKSNVGTSGTLNLATVSGDINQEAFTPPVSSILRSRNITANGGVTAGDLNVTLGTDASAHLTNENNAVSHFSLQGDHGHTELVNSIDLTVTGASDANGSLDITQLGGHTLGQSDAIHVDSLKVTMKDGGDFDLTHADNDVNSFSANATGNNTRNTQGSFVDGSGGFTLASSDMGNGDLTLEAHHGGNINQSGSLIADELKLTMVDGGDADLSTHSNLINALSANAKNSASPEIIIPILLRTPLEGILQIPPILLPVADQTGNTQIQFRNDKDLNLTKSELGNGDLGLTLHNGSHLNQTHLDTSRDITTTGGVHANELSVSLHNGGSADLTTQINTVDVFVGHATGTQNNNAARLIINIEEPNNNSTSVIKFNNDKDLNLAQSNVGDGSLIIRANGVIDNANRDNANRTGTDRDITQNNSTLTGGLILLTADGNGSIHIHNDVNAGSSAQLTTANPYGTIYIHSGSTVASRSGNVLLNSNGLTLDGHVQGQLVQIWPWDLSMSMGIGGAPGGLLLSQGLINHINTDPELGLNAIMFGHKDYTGTIKLGTLDLSRHTNTDVAFNALRVFDATPNRDNRPNLIMAANRDVYFTAGAESIEQWASAPGGLSYGDNSSRFADLDVNVSGSGLIHVRLVDFTGSGTGYALITPGGKAFINAQDDDESGSLKNLGSALSNRSSSIIINQLKGNTITLPGNPLEHLPTSYGNIRPVQFIPNQSL